MHIPEGLTLRTAYWQDKKAKAAFNRLMITLFNLDFSQWDTAGYWDDRFVPFSLFKADTVLASVCLYMLNAVVHGRHTRLAQISSVGTLPAWRRRGLARMLNDYALTWARDRQEWVFLFADPEAVPFYETCGFTPIKEYVEILSVPDVTPRKGIIRLDPAVPREREKIYHYAQCRAPLSRIFSVLNANLLMFHTLYWLKNCAYEIPDLDCLVFYKRLEGCVKIYDVLAENIPDLKALYAYIASPEDQRIECRFHTDKLYAGKRKLKLLQDNLPFVHGPFPFKQPVFPYTSLA